MYDGNEWNFSWNSDSENEYVITLKTWKNGIYAGFGNGVIYRDDAYPTQEITVISPENMTYYNHVNTMLKLSANESVLSVDYSLDHQTNVTILTDTARTYRKTIYVPSYRSPNIIEYAREDHWKHWKLDRIYPATKRIWSGKGSFKHTIKLY